MSRPVYRDFVATAIPIEGYQISSGHVIHNSDIAAISERLLGLLRAFSMSAVTFEDACSEIGELMKEVEDTV